jgi:predicted DNA-binding transcriptional regulator AlpA
MDRLLTLSEVAEMTRLPVATLRYFRHCSTGPRSAKLGRRVVYRESDVNAWIEAQFAAERPTAQHVGHPRPGRPEHGDAA